MKDRRCCSGHEWQSCLCRRQTCRCCAFGKTFNDPHYCFLTPIGKMLPLLDEPRELPADWIPKGTALMAGGFTEYGMEYLQEKLQPFGLTAVNSGGTGASSDKPLEPGSSVGVALMQGDMTLGALGTVTWTDDSGKILAFGHPFMQRGSSNFFMNKVWVLGVVPNLQSSYKVGNLGEAIGSITQDRASGIRRRSRQAACFYSDVCYGQRQQPRTGQQHAYASDWMMSSWCLRW